MSTSSSEQKVGGIIYGMSLVYYQHISESIAAVYVMVSHQMGFHSGTASNGHSG
jgi:hypothetical protein